MSGLATFFDMAFSFKGRLRRRDYWGMSIVLVVVQLNLTRIVLTNLYAGGTNPEGALSTPLALVIAETVLALPFAWSNFAMINKRFHDQDKSSKWGITAWAVCILPLWVMPFFEVLLVGELYSLTLLTIVLLLLTFPAFLYVLVIAGFLNGTPGPNRFGPSPKAKEFAKVSE